MPNPSTNKPERGHELNPDPLTGEPGAHPVGTGIGAAAGGATGAAVGSAAGPVGTAVGAVVGAVVGGLAGKGVAEAIDPTAEDAYWREHHDYQPYAADDRTYDDYAPAYRAGYTGYREGQTFEEREADLRMEYEGGPRQAETENEPATTKAATPQKDRAGDPMRWDAAREAARAAYDRVARGEAYRAEPRTKRLTE
jgi:hypothetical protein